MSLRLYIFLFPLFLIPLDVGATPNTISVIIDNNYPPYSFIDEKGNLSGISIDLWKLWEEKSKIKVNITGESWSEALRRMESGEFDVIDTIFYTEERSRKYDFSKPYARIDVVIFFDKNLSSFNNVSSLKGMRVGIKSGDANIDFLVKNGITDFKEYKNYEDVVKAAKNKEIRVFVIDKPPGLFFIYKNRVEDEFRYSEPLYNGEFHRAVRKGNIELLSLIESRFEKISEKEKAAIEEKWLGYPIPNPKYKNYFKISLFILAGLILLVAIIYFWIRMLQISVAERTMELKLAKEKADKFAQELLESEKRYTTLYQNIMDIIFTVRLDGKILDLNPKGLSLLNLKRDELATLKISDIMDEKNQKLVFETIKKRLDNPNAVFTFEVISKDRKVYILETKGTLLYKDGKPYAIQGIARDITEIKKLEKHIIESQKLESIGILAGGIAHDFNNILMGILNYIEFLKKDYGNKDAFFSDIQYLKNSAEKAAKLVQQLLGFSRKQLIMPDNLDINELIQKLSTSLLKYIGENIKIELKLCTNSPAIFADSSQIEQIIINIILNSKDAMPEGGTITIQTEVVDIQNEVEGSNTYSGRFVVLSIKDTGVGIHQDIMNRIFEPFFTTKPVGKGTGLGLSMVYGAMQQNKGFVRILSEVGKGTEVRLFFPFMEKKEKKEETKGIAQPIKGNGSTILLVEDSEDALIVIRQILNTLGYNVLEAKNFKEAIYQFELNSDLISLIISDIVLPDKNGLELKKEIKKKQSDIPILFITGYSEIILKNRGIAVGEDLILYKPFTSEKLATALRMLESKPTLETDRLI